MPNGMYGGVRGERKSPLLDYGLVLCDCTHRALSCAGTAVNALFRVDFKFSISCADCAYRALSLAGSTGYAAVTDTICHD